MGVRIPTVKLTTPSGIEICPDGVNIRLTSFDCNWKDDGKDDISLTFKSRNVALLHSCGFVYEGLVVMSFGYTDGNMSQAIPYTIQDVERRYTEKGLSVSITLASQSTPLDTMAGDVEDTFDPEDMDPEGDQEGQEAIFSTERPIDFLTGLMGNSLVLQIVYNGKVTYTYDKVEKGNGYIPDNFVFDYIAMVNLMGYDFQWEGVPYKNRPVYAGPLQDPESLVAKEQRNQVITSSDFKGLPDSVINFLMTKRAIEKTAKKMIANVRNLLSFMPEGPWYITRRGNLFMIHDRGIGVRAGTGGESQGGQRSALRQFNFYSDDNTILSATIKHDSEKLNKDATEAIAQDPTLRTVNRVVQYNTAINTALEIYKKAKNQSLGVNSYNVPYSTYVDTRPLYNYGNTWQFGALGAQGEAEAIRNGYWVEGEGQVEAVKKGFMLNKNLKYTIDGMEITLEDYKKFNEAIRTAKALHKDAGVDKLYVNENSRVVNLGPESPDEVDPRRSKFGSAGGTARMPYIPITKTKKEKFFTYDLVDKDTKKVLPWSGMIHYVQAQISDDALWKAANNVKAQAIEGIIATVTIEGDPTIMDGMVMRLTGLGNDSGDYYVKAVRHSISSSQGYRTTMECCKQAGDEVTVMLNNVREFKEYDYEDIRRIFIGSALFGVNTRYRITGPSDPDKLFNANPNDKDNFGKGTDGTVQVWDVDGAGTYISPNDPYLKQKEIDAAMANINDGNVKVYKPDNK